MVERGAAISRGATVSQRNSFLTSAMEKFLAAIRDDEDEYAIQEGIAVWVGMERFHASTVLKCLQYCLISEDQYSDEKTRIWIHGNFYCRVVCLKCAEPFDVHALAQERHICPACEQVEVWFNGLEHDAS